MSNELPQLPACVGWMWTHDLLGSGFSRDPTSHPDYVSHPLYTKRQMIDFALAAAPKPAEGGDVATQFTADNVLEVMRACEALLRNAERKPPSTITGAEKQLAESRAVGQRLRAAMDACFVRQPPPENGESGQDWICPRCLCAPTPPPAAQAAGASMEPVAWAQSRTIDDDDGRPIGSDEPRVVWGAEDPDPGFGWWPLYPAPVAAISAGDVWLEGWKACRREVFGLCEHTIDEELPQAESEHHAGYQRGRYQEAKAIARAMNSFEPTVPDHLAPKEK
jgi:hypothetical protein